MGVVGHPAPDERPRMLRLHCGKQVIRTGRGALARGACPAADLRRHTPEPVGAPEAPRQGFLRSDVRYVPVLTSVDRQRLWNGADLQTQHRR